MNRAAQELRDAIARLMDPGYAVVVDERGAVHLWRLV